MTPKQKLARMKRGTTVITNGQELDAMLTLGDDAIYEVRSLPNPKQVGTKDQYIAWIGEPPTVGELIESQAAEVGELQEEVKRQSMIYQYDLKQEAMRRFGLRWEEVDLPYKEWAKIRARL